MNSSLILIVVLLFICCIELIQAGELGKEDVSKEKLAAEEAALNITEECGLYKVVTEPIALSDFDATAKFVRRVKCGISCMLKSIGLITDNNELVKEAIPRFNRKNPGRGYFVSICTDEEFYDKCSLVKDSDDCEYANKLYNCYKSICKEKSK